jgi:hypothetical protein
LANGWLNKDPFGVPTKAKIKEVTREFLTERN